MIFSLNTALKPIALKVMHESKPISYSWGNVDALHRWIEAMNMDQVQQALGINEKRKYPLIWLDDNWTAKENIPGINFTNVNIYISFNSNVEKTSENRVPNFDINYQIANDFISELEKIALIKENTKKYFERANFSTKEKKDGENQSFASDIWDTLILSLEMTIIPKGENCFL